ncbi:serine/threonine-protein kinase 10-like [Zophobas morio]|uniref:serine/threonine-protein kinase 10-like n=1 Tax=Zophobas morio TaxID=2755281 RepID=UPI00308354DE
MAPEVILCENIRDKPYDHKCDIWSLGITCIEMAEMNPPLHDLHPIKVLYSIPKSDPPTLADSCLWSNEFKDFVTLALMKDPAARPSVKELLAHPFVTGCSEEESMNVMAGLVDEFLNIQYEEEDEENISDGQEELKEFDSSVPVKHKTIIKTTYKRNMDGSRQRVTRRVDEETQKANNRVKAFRQQQIAALKALNRENERKRLDIKHSKALEELLSSHKASLEALERKYQADEAQKFRQNERELLKLHEALCKNYRAQALELETIRKKEFKLFKEKQQHDYKEEAKHLKSDLKNCSKLEKKEQQAFLEMRHTSKAEKEDREYANNLRYQHLLKLHKSELQNLKEYLSLKDTLANSFGRLRLDNISELAVNEKKFLREEHELKTFQLVQMQLLESKRQEIRHQKEMEMMDALCQKRITETKRAQKVRKAAFPIQQKKKSREAQKAFLLLKENELKRLKEAHRQLRDESGKKIVERKAMKKIHEEEEKYYIMEMEEKFRAEEMAQRNSEIEELLKSFKRDLESIEALNIEEINELKEQHREKEVLLRESHRIQKEQMADTHNIEFNNLLSAQESRFKLIVDDIEKKAKERQKEAKKIEEDLLRNQENAIRSFSSEGNLLTLRSVCSFTLDTK